MFVASYARLPPGSRFHLSVNVRILPCNALYRVLAVTIWVGSDRLIQCAVPPRYHLGTTSLRLGPFITMRGTASVPLGPSITMRGTARALHYNARYLPRYSSGPLLQCAVPLRYTASVPLGPSISMRGTASVPLGPSITMRGTASVPLGPSILQCAVPPRDRFGTARALYYNARYRRPVCVLQSSNWIGVRNFHENTKTNRKPRNATLTL